jgi:acyl-ACP thioesterase
VERLVEITGRVGLGDVRPDGRMRLDAISRVLQDAADRDAATADVPDMGVWILRRLVLDIAHTPRLRAELRASTWCSGVGARWAERRTDVHVGNQLCITATALWVHVDPARGVPTVLPPGFHETWAPSAHGRTVSARLSHAPPPGDAARRAWPLRATDFDVMAHVNNAAYWAPVEEELAARGGDRVSRAEIEFRAGIDRGDEVELRTAAQEGGFACWLCVAGDVRASMLVGCVSS